MIRFTTVSLLMLGFSANVSADVWRWVDAAGNTHFVDTLTPIYTWVDESGQIHYSDSPDHEDAVSIELVWHSKGSLAELKSESDRKNVDKGAHPGESPEDRARREAAQAYYCEQATKIYDSYVNAPKLYRTGKDGEREYLSSEDAARTIAETKARKDELCS